MTVLLVRKHIIKAAAGARVREYGVASAIWR
jgi:hypothetical protein